MVRLLRHRQTKGAATARLDLRPPRHISTLLQSPLVILAVGVVPTTRKYKNSIKDQERTVPDLPGKRSVEVRGIIMFNIRLMMKKK